MKDRVLYAAIAGFTGGIFLRSFVDIGYSSSLFLLLLAGVIVILHFLTRSDLVLGKRSDLVILLCIFLSATALGMLRFDLADRKEVRFAFDSQLGAQVSFQGLVIDEPDERETTTRLIVALEQAKKTKILIITDRE